VVKLKKNKIRIKIPEDWEYFFQKSFVKVGKKKSFSIGTIFKRTREEFFQLRKNGLKELRKKCAYRNIMRTIAKYNPSDLVIPYYHGGKKKRYVEISSIKTKVPNSSVKTVISPQPISITVDNFEPCIIEAIENREIEIIRNQQNRFPKQANHKAMNLLKNVVNSYPQLEFNKDNLKVKSMNGKFYQICMKSGTVKDSSGNQLCVVTSIGNSIPRFDIILAKALVIAFSPKEIYTLH